MKKITPDRQFELINLLETRFNKHLSRHKNVSWHLVLEKLTTNESLLYTVDQMELTGGEPDVVSLDPLSHQLFYVDCAKESPSGRRSLCYDQAALDARKEFKPIDSAVNLAGKMGITLLNEAQYATLQSFGDFDTKTSSWLFTPKTIRELDGALFGDKRYNHVFTYHNGAQSYYKDRGFRGFVVL